MPIADQRITDNQARNFPPPETGQVFYWCPTTPGFAVRVTATGARSWVLERRVDGKTKRRTLGAVIGRNAISGKAARDLALTTSSDLSRGVDIKEVRETQRAQERQRKADAVHTLEALLTDYCNHLEKLQRSSHKDARTLFKKNVFEAWPSVAALPAREVSRAQIVDVLRKVSKAGNKRTANKLRSYLKAAFNVAIGAGANPAIPASFGVYGVLHNPLDGIPADPAGNQADRNPFSRDDVRAYWKRLKAVDGLPGAVLRLHVLTAGQRIAQLLRAERKGKELHMLDGKGRPGHGARLHIIPLTSEAAAEWDRAEGINGVHPSTVSAWAREHGGVQAKRVRSTVETLLAASGVSQEVRGRLQSHGITGVQSRNYNAHDYVAEKLAALKLWQEMLFAPDATKQHRQRKTQRVAR